jgi:hypothetical protein
MEKGIMCKKMVSLASVVFVLGLLAGTANSGLVAHWTFDEGSGPTAYDSAGTNHGSISGATWTTGKVGGALSFDGINDYVDGGNGASLDNMPAITLAAWIYPKGWGGSGEGRIISKRHWPQSAYELKMSPRNELDRVSADFYGDNDIVAVHSGIENIVLNHWYHLAATSDGLHQKIYVNGIEMGSNNVNIGDIKDIPVNLWIGQMSDVYVNCAFDGIIDDVRIYNNVLSQSEVMALVPEPATLVLLGAGLLFIRRQRRYRR